MSKSVHAQHHKVTNILVLDANQRSALAVTRSLGKRAHLSVTTADSSHSALAGSSRYSAQYLRYPCPMTRPKDFLSELERIVREYRIGYLQPTTEVTSRLLVQNRSRFPDSVIPFPDPSTVMAVSDKSRLTRRAMELGIPVPATRYYSSLQEWDFEAESDFPLIVKPALSKIHVDDGWISTTVRKVNSQAELRAVTERDAYLAQHPFMVQEYIPGHGGGIFALAKDGEIICRFAHQRLREKPPGGGVSVLCRSAETNDDLSRYADRILQACKWSGVAMVEFRVSDSGVPYLMEINTRFWGSLQLSIDSGLDFPYLLYQLYSGNPPASEPRYRVGNQLRWYLGDLDNLYLTCRDANVSAGRKLRHLLGFLKYHRDTRHEIFRLNDPLPAYFELRSYINQVIGAK